jgi:hypothetical protein
MVGYPDLGEADPGGSGGLAPPQKTKRLEEESNYVEEFGLKCKSVRIGMKVFRFFSM